MIPLTRQRRFAAIFLLTLMTMNFVSEGFSIYLAHFSRLFPQAHPAVCAVDSRASHAGESHAESCCAAKKPEPKSCGCPCCGETCPMGDACTCDHDGKPKSRSAGLFFQSPGCHPDQNNFDSSYLPLSMRVIFLSQSAADPSTNLRCVGSVSITSIKVAGILPAPPVPPPRFAAA